MRTQGGFTAEQLEERLNVLQGLIFDDWPRIDLSLSNILTLRVTDVFGRSNQFDTYTDLYIMAGDRRAQALESLILAKEFLRAGNLQAAENYRARSLEYVIDSGDLVALASDVLLGAIDDAISQAKLVYNVAKYSGLAVGKLAELGGVPFAYKAIDYYFMGLDFWVTSSLEGTDEAVKDVVAGAVAGILLDQSGVTDWIGDHAGLASPPDYDTWTSGLREVMSEAVQSTDIQAAITAAFVQQGLGHLTGGFVGGVIDSVAFSLPQDIPTLPHAPSLLAPASGAPVGTTMPTFTWERVAGADSYGLYISEPPYGSDHVVYDSESDGGEIQGNSYALPSGTLRPGVTYRWNMRAYNATTGWGPFSEPRTFMVDGDPEARVTSDAIVIRGQVTRAGSLPLASRGLTVTVSVHGEPVETGSEVVQTRGDYRSEFEAEPGRPLVVTSGDRVVVVVEDRHGIGRGRVERDLLAEEITAGLAVVDVETDVQNGEVLVIVDPNPDINGDGWVNIVDAILIGRDFGRFTRNAADPRSDVNGDAWINIVDLAIWGRWFGSSWPPSTAAPAGTARPGSDGLLSELTAYIRTHPEDRHLWPLLVWALDLPGQPAVGQNYPNPFNPETWIPFELNEGADVTLTVYDGLGRVVRRLQLGHRRPGVYLSRNRAAHWDGRNDHGEEMASGTYFVELTADEFREMRRIVLLK